MPNFKYLLYDPATAEEYGVSVKIETKENLTRNDEKDFLVARLFNEDYNNLSSQFFSSGFGAQFWNCAGVCRNVDLSTGIMVTL